MKLSAIRVSRFQSLWDVDLVLGDLTVIVGPSNSGKSAIGRALRMAARNVSSSGFVSTGAKSATVSVTLDDGHRVHVERGPGSSTYRLETPDGEMATYAKSGKDVPEDVARVLAMPEPEHGPDLYFSTQFDGPHLLSANGPTASAALGELTNATTLAEAVREGNRRRMEAARTSSARRQDSERGQQELRDSYLGLRERQSALDRAESLHEKIQTMEDAATLLRGLANGIADLDVAIESLIAGTYHLPDLTEVEASVTRARVLRTLASSIQESQEEAESSASMALTLRERADELEALTMEKLREAGMCPTCGGKVA